MLFAGRRVEAVNGLRVPDDELARAAGRDNCRGAITDLRSGQVLPNLSARVFVERDDFAAVAASEANEPIAVEERRSREPPDRNAGAIVCHEVLCPDLAARFRIEAE